MQYGWHRKPRRRRKKGQKIKGSRLRQASAQQERLNEEKGKLNIQLVPDDVGMEVEDAHTVCAD
jgi:hypothetical protein